MPNPPRLWWQDIDPVVWRCFGQPEDLARERNTAVLAALEELATRAPMSTPAEVSAQMREVGFRDPVSEAELRAVLEYLTSAHLVEPFRDYAALNAGLDAVVRRQEAWALTKIGRAVVAAVRSAVVDSRRALQLPSRLLDSVERTIRDLLDHLSSDAGLLPTDLDDVRTRLEEIQRVTADFYAALAQMVQSDVTDNLLFGENRDRVVEALRQFPREYGRALRRVESALNDLEIAGYRPLVEAAAGHAGLLDVRDQQNWIDERVRRLSDLAAWFAPSGSVQRLISSAAGAVHTLLVAIDRRYTALRRGSDLAADFRELAYSLYAQPDDDAARRVYAAAFGQWPAVHAVVGTVEEDVAHSATAAAGVSRHQVEVVLREHERVGRVSGRPRKVPDSAGARAAALAKAAAAAADRRRFAALLATGGEVPLSHFAGLETPALVILLGAIEVARNATDATTGYGEAQAEGANVVVRVRLGRPDVHVPVRFAEGVLVAPELFVLVTATDAGDGSAVAVERGAA
ncbi:uncharacterized protein (TIGR02677 family) [Actinoplanes tereljensis]|uniref:DUF2397 family protein n=1 Tax=Paractinoplanes tereljensis TaxID=571912 RepID=A0A919NQT5_9ACTN|nr:DUF2397 family protein [Actinoplanes tereljensis]GIF23416.1 hypothetical protein Ate02nite_61460 [Actinoplanes tereljensis]